MDRLPLPVSPLGASFSVENKKPALAPPLETPPPPPSPLRPSLLLPSSRWREDINGGNEIIDAGNDNFISDVKLSIAADTSSPIDDKLANVKAMKLEKNGTLQDLRLCIDQLKDKSDLQRHHIDTLESLHSRLESAKLVAKELDHEVVPEPKFIEKVVLNTTAEIMREMFILFVLFPGFILLACLILGSFLALIEDWSCKTGFEYMVSVTCGLANPLGKASNVSPTTNTGMTIAGVCGMWVIGVTGILGGWASKAKVVQCTLRMFHKAFGTHKFTAISAVAFLVYPLALGLVVLTCGCFLASVESWKWNDGFFYILADVSGLPNPLVQSSPKGGVGTFFATIVSAWCYVFAGILVGLASNLELPSAAYARKNFCCVGSLPV